MDYRVIRIYDNNNFQNITKGIKVAQCMKKNNSDSASDVISYQLNDLTISNCLSCSYCNANFEDQAQQRLHYKLDWHRYNLKQHLNGLKSVAESDFDEIFAKDNECGSSDSDSPAESESESKYHNDKNDNEKANRHLKVFFENDDGDIFSIYRCLLHNKKEIPEKEGEIIFQALQSGIKTIWTVIMLSGGHFSAAVYQDGEAIVHKTFHAYTVRAKQGTSQSTRDNRAGNFSKSAGASLRRYNAEVLQKNIQDLLNTWSDHMLNSSLILYRAVGPQNRTMLFGGKNPPLNKNDLKLRPIPFPTRKVTFTEVQRVYGMLSAMEIYGSAENYTTSFPVSPRQNQFNKTVKDDVKPKNFKKRSLLVQKSNDLNDGSDSESKSLKDQTSQTSDFNLLNRKKYSQKSGISPYKHNFFTTDAFDNEDTLISEFIYNENALS